MSTQSSTIVQRVWNYCNVLRDDGISYGDYVERRLSVVEKDLKESRKITIKELMKLAKDI